MVFSEQNMNPAPLLPDNPRFAGFFIRLSAQILDGFFFILFFLLLFFLIYGADFFLDPPETIDFQLFFLNHILPFLIVAFFWKTIGATPGKWLLGIQIVDQHTGRPPQFYQIVFRYLGYLVSALVFLLGFLWVVWDPRKQSWHDKFAGTLVIFRK